MRVSPTVRAEAVLLISLVHVVVVVDRSDYLVPGPDMGVLLDQQRIAEQSEILGCIDFPFDQSGHLATLIGDAQGRIETGDLQAIERKLTSAGDLADDVEIVFAEASVNS